MNLTVEEILAIIAPELADYDASGAIAVANMQIAPNLCGDKRPLLVAYLAAHIITIGNRANGATGSIASVTEGKTSITYGTSQLDIPSSGLSDTSYGREYDRLRRGCVVAITTGVSKLRCCR